MRNILHFSGTVLLALVMQGCATTAVDLEKVGIEYDDLKKQMTDYEPVGDAKIDGLARPFVTSANQLSLEFDKVKKEYNANPITVHFKNVSPSKYAEAYEALKPEEKAKVDEARRALKDADTGRLNSLLKQLTDLGIAGGRLALEIKDASGGGSGGAMALGNSLVKAASGPGGKAIEQVNRGVKMADNARIMIDWYLRTPAEVDKAIEQNARKAQS
jgi:hypothetical protein